MSIHLAHHRARFEPVEPLRPHSQSVNSDASSRQKKASAGRTLFFGAICKSLTSAAASASDDSAEEASEALHGAAIGSFLTVQADPTRLFDGEKDVKDAATDRDDAMLKIWTSKQMRELLVKATPNGRYVPCHGRLTTHRLLLKQRGDHP